jgi:hypothetical protein
LGIRRHHGILIEYGKLARDAGTVVRGHAVCVVRDRPDHRVAHAARASPSAIAFVIVLGLARLFRLRSFRATVAGRVLAALLSLLFLTGLTMAYRFPAAEGFLHERGVASYTPMPVIELEYNGLLLNLLLHVGDLSVPVPPAMGPLALNVLAFAAFTSLATALTNRSLFSVAVVTLLYELLVLCNRLKIGYLATPVHPADLFVLSNLWHVHLFTTRVLAAVAAGI